ncbi:TraB/GumN family protein [Oricola sp.]|uniref:TraB/GumN family protein n=1 Tax=Oricola sp. TaxID=1979950 RepID=UPI0025F6F375|nr:TraB/GumN family protein [Oricola sp.]MCI5074997.1 TraB/GumN family protein [Oricola sp.]
MNAFVTRLDRLSGPLLAALGLANALFMLSFLAVLLVAMQSLPAAAADDCRGENLLTAMQTEDPDTYRQVMDEAAATINGDTRLFRIDRQGLEPSYLFGTMHLTDERLIDLPPRARDGFDASGTVAIESTEILDPAKAQLAIFAKPELTMFTGKEDLSDYLTEEQRRILVDGLAARGIQLALVERMKPWLILGMVALPPCEMDRKQAGKPFLDVKIAQDAQRDGKELVGLETIMEQFDAMASLPIEFHVRALVETVSYGDRIDDMIETMIELYVSGQTAKVWPMLRAVTPQPQDGSDAAADYAEFEEALVHIRNETMVERALPLLEKGGAFIAVGALHLPGERGLAALIDKAGYTVTPLYE